MWNDRENRSLNVELRGTFARRAYPTIILLGGPRRTVEITHKIVRGMMLTPSKHGMIRQ